MQKEKVKKIYLENLPRKEGIAINKGKQVIDWENSTNIPIYFNYNGIKGYIIIIKYELKGQILHIKYLDKEPFKISTSNFRDCRFGKLLGKKTEEFKFKIGQVIKDDKRDITIIDKKKEKSPYKKGGMLKYYKYRCNKCGFECDDHYKKGKYYKEHWMEEHNLSEGKGCSVCCKFPQVVVPEINSIVANEETHWMIKYFQDGYNNAKKYNKTSNQKIIPICPDCSRVKDKEIIISHIYKQHSIGCTCSDNISYPEKLLICILKYLNIKFKYQYIPDWIKPRRYDFYFELNDKKYIIETDGGWGHGVTDNKLSGITKEESQVIDDYKDRLADKHGITIIRIDCKISDLDWIKNNDNGILNSELADLFDLSKIDWLKVEEFALSNLVKKACEIKKDNPNMTTTQIGEIMNLNCQTIIRYLKKGAKLGWCDYNPKEEKIKIIKEVGKINRKLVEIYKDGIKLNYPPFESCSELSRQSEKLFGVKLYTSNISLVCLSKQSHHKGFTFQYI